LTKHLRGQKSTFIVMAKDIVRAFATYDKTSNNRQVIQIFGVDRRNIKRAIERWHTLNNNGDAFWPQRRTTKRIDVLCETTVQQIVAFWTSKTIISPNSKDITRRRTRRKQYEVHATHYLQVFQVYNSYT
jgi:hypothetical protein